MQTPIDAFILVRLEENQLVPSPPVDSHVLVRRLYFDLIGCQPGKANGLGRAQTWKTLTGGSPPVAGQRICPVSRPTNSWWAGCIKSYRTWGWMPRRWMARRSRLDRWLGCGHHPVELGQNVVKHFSRNVRQTKVATAIAIGEVFVVQTQNV